MRITPEFNSSTRLDNDNFFELQHTAHSILPNTLILEGTRISTCLPGLMDEELPFIRNAIKKRRVEFNAGRVCARRALYQVGIRPTPLLAGKMREPIWPKNIVGSITHDGDLCFVSVQNNEVIRGIGIDVTDKDELNKDIINLICTQMDIDNIINLRDKTLSIDPFKIVFSIKESVFKCLFPIVNQIFDFHDVSIAFDRSIHQVKIFLLNKQLFDGFDLKLYADFCSIENYIFTGVWLE